MMQQQHSTNNPVTLQGPAAAKSYWWQAYYDSKNAKYQQRVLLSGGAKTRGTGV